MPRLLIPVSLCAGLLLGACATLPPGWKQYRAAVKCDLQNREKPCDPLYEAAIRANPNLPGVYSSYGAHLHGRGEIPRAQEYFRKEAQRNPEAAPAVGLVLDRSPAHAPETVSHETH